MNVATSLLTALKSAVRFALEATPFGTARKRKREGSAEGEEGIVEPSPKRPAAAAPGSTKKALLFDAEQQERQRSRAGAAGARHVATPSPPPPAPPSAQPAPQLPQPAPLQRPALGEGLIRQAAQPRTVYNSPQLPATRRTPAGFRRPPVPAAGGSSSLLFSAPRSQLGAVQPAGAQQGGFLGQLGQTSWVSRFQAPSTRQPPALYNLPPRSPAYPLSHRSGLAKQPANLPAYLSTAAAPSAPVPRAMGQCLPKILPGGFGEDHVNRKERHQLKYGVKLSQKIEEVHQHAAPPPTLVVDLVAEELQAGQQQQQQQQRGQTPALRGMAAAVPGLTRTPGGSLPFTPSLLRTAEQQRYAALQPAEIEPPFTTSLLRRDEELRRKEEDYKATVAEAHASKQHADVVTKAALAAARKAQTALERREEQLLKQMQQEQEGLLQLQQRREARSKLAAPKQQVPPAPKPAATEEEEDVIELLSDDEGEEERVLGESSSIVGAVSEEESEEVSQQLAELSVSEVLPQLTNEHYDLYADVLQAGGNQMERLVLHERSQIEIRRKEIACMAPLQWLNDEVINIYMALLLERDMRRRSSQGALKCHFFSTFFLNKLYKDTGYKYKDVARWTVPRRLKVQGQLCESILDCDRVIMPVHQGVHWVCAVIDVANKQLVYYDSLKGEDHKCLDMLAQYVADEYQNKRNETVDTSSWDRVFPKNIPQQHNGCDCGVFTLLFADYASRAAPMKFGQKDIDYFRVKIVNDILRQRVD